MNQDWLIVTGPRHMLQVSIILSEVKKEGWKVLLVATFNICQIMICKNNKI